MSANKYGLTTSSPFVPLNPLLCSDLHVFAFLEAAIGVRCARFDLDNSLLASLHVKGFMVDAM